MMAKKLSLRPLFQGVLIGSVAVLVACSGPPPAVVTDRPTNVPAATNPTQAPTNPTQATTSAQPTTAAPATTSQYTEAPQLAEQVKAGTLPAVDQRLPKDPMVVTPVQEVGVYGGQWRMGMLGASDDVFLSRTIGYEGLVRWDTAWKEVVPNLAKSWELSPDGTEITFVLREGVKWSDGTPFTADDIMFWYEDIILNEEITNDENPAPDWLEPGDEVAKVTKVNDFTVKMTFDVPIGLMLQEIADLSGTRMLIPAHYAKQFHKKYNPDVEKLATEQQLSSWVELFQTKVTETPAQEAAWFNAERPTLNAWMVKTPIGEGQRVVAVRNPYYWKVDTAGNQLPYLDEVIFEVAENPDVLVLKALNGEIDMQDRHINDLKNKAVFVDNQQKGGFDFYEVVPSEMSQMILSLNLTHSDPVLRELFNKKEFRIALSHAINRQEISDVAYVGQGAPHQAAPLPESRFYREKMAKQFTEFDLAKANQILDELGLQRGPDGVRLLPNGKPLELGALVRADFVPRVDSLQLIQKTWAEIGVTLRVDAVERALFRTRSRANEYDIATSGGNGGLSVLLEPRFYFPYENPESYFAPLWAEWAESNGEEGEEPNAQAKKAQELYQQIRITADPAKQDELMSQILAIAEEEFWAIGTVTWAPSYGIVQNNFKNVPATMFEAENWPSPGPTNPEQYFIKP
jgi:peptide/nickel transport system substrate-binding protein